MSEGALFLHTLLPSQTNLPTGIEPVAPFMQELLPKYAVAAFHY